MLTKKFEIKIRGNAQKTGKLEFMFDIKDLTSMDLLAIQSCITKSLKSTIVDVCKKEAIDPVDVVWPLSYINYQMERFLKENNIDFGGFRSAVITKDNKGK